MVTAPHAQAARVGAHVLSQGGSAADAAVAVGATLAVLYPHMTGIGGDAFWIYHDAMTRATIAYNGSGRSAALATLQYYRDRGARSIPFRGPLAVLTVPGAVDAWCALHGRFGRMEMDRLLAPAISFARDGTQPARSVAKSLEEERVWLEQDAGAKGIFCTQAGTRDFIAQPALARTLEMIARKGRGWFYQGEAAATVSAWAESAGSPLRAGDFAAHAGMETQPLATALSGFESLTTPPNSQGLTLLVAQQIMEARFGAQFPADCTGELVHHAVEAAKIAYEVRDRYVGDPEAFPLPKQLRDTGEIARIGATPIADTASARSATVGGDGDTTYFACVDNAGNAVSYIQSLYHHFGAAVAVPALGLVLQNRGIAFTLDEGQIRSLVPNRRPFHTLMPAMLCKEGLPAVIYGSMGGDAQPQIGLALSIRMARLGETPQAAIDAPRWRWSSEAAGPAGGVAVERRMPQECIEELRARGHRVTVLGDWEESMGHAGAIVLDRARGVFVGAADPRSDGAAIGL